MAARKKPAVTKAAAKKPAAKKSPAKKSSAPKRPSPKLMEALKNFIRTDGASYLEDENITSVGIGYRTVDGKPTDEIVIQFTVAEKMAPDLIEALGMPKIPETIVVDGKKIPTDVVERRFKTEFKIVTAAPEASQRKARIDPIVPGVSVANTTVTAGTIGCIVYDRTSGAPYILSNWHVLHGPRGRIGDDIVQPGPHDDNRTGLNRLGKLVRSHLGAAGDCAVASIEDRAFLSDIIDLGVTVDKIGEPELGDKVVKSGRTTDVTHGRVTRVSVMVKINYGAPTGNQTIGGFEIGPDSAHPPANGEISMGGDSGSAWLFKASNGKPSTVMAGLHFAGEGAGDPNEHAIACYPKSVFEKLQIVPTPPAVAPVDGGAGTVAGALGVLGYRSAFLGRQVAPPKLNATKLRDAVKLNDSEVIPYTHFSLAQSKSRRFAFWVAWNIDGTNMKRISRAGIPFILDPRIPKKYQVGDELYAGNRLDRGHIARRADLLWGPLPEAEKANVDSFYFTNITPQMDEFNQSTRGGLWGKLEEALFEEVDVDNLKVSVFGGPVFRDDDRTYRGVKIPRAFFKVLAYIEAGQLKAKAFMLTQSLDELEVLDLDRFKVYQVALREIEQRCGFRFPNNLRMGDSYAELLEERAEIVAEREELESVDDIVW